MFPWVLDKIKKAICTCLPPTSAGWILHCWEMKASSPAEFQKSPSVLILLDKQNIYIFTIQINFYLGILHMSCYEKREITFVLKNCSFQAWNIFLVFYSSQLVLASVGACIHKAIGPKQHYWGIDQKIKPLCMKLKSRQGPARVKLIFTIYSFKIRMLERVQPIASVPNRTARKLHQRIPKGLWPQTAELLLCFSKGVWNTSICSRVIQVLQPPISPYLQPHGTVQPRRRNGAPASHPKSGLEGRVPCAVSRWGPKRCPPLLYNPDPTAACRGLSFHEGCRHTGMCLNNSQLCTETGDYTGLLVALFAFGKQSLMLALSQTGFWGTALI